ncbi:helix-turn-helix domain-containing protein [Pedobacter gandavensis]|uniref:helix-turn-helix domain-containing protein n=1 Tax=Pedobacter gandavensis TaxID=2679963 RepID=UPI002931F060|nr:helix-turn-helix domain-containing protein [Pedobacter gandavensis]
MKQDYLMLKLLRQLLKVQTDQLAALLKLEPPQLLPEQKKEEEVWLHTQDVMRIFSKSERTIYNWRKAGMLRYRVIGGTTFYLQSDVYKLVHQEF